MNVLRRAGWHAASAAIAPHLLQTRAVLARHTVVLATRMLSLPPLSCRAASGSSAAAAVADRQFTAVTRRLQLWEEEIARQRAAQAAAASSSDDASKRQITVTIVPAGNVGEAQELTVDSGWSPQEAVAGAVSPLRLCNQATSSPHTNN